MLSAKPKNKYLPAVLLTGEQCDQKAAFYIKILTGLRGFPDKLSYLTVFYSYP